MVKGLNDKFEGLKTNSRKIKEMWSTLTQLPYTGNGLSNAGEDGRTN